MIITKTNIETVPGMKIKSQFGLVSGSSVRAKNLFEDIGASVKNLIGGELEAYTVLLAEARKEATERMEEQAELLGANAIVNIRYATSSITEGAAEVYAYGTAVYVESIGE